MSHPESLATCVDETAQLGAVSEQLSRKASRSRVLNGSIIMFISTTLVAVLNFIFNVVMARIMGPAEFGQITAVVTILMLTSAISLSFQLVCAKFVARNETAGERVSIFKGLLSRAWIVSAAVGGAFFILRKPAATYLHMPDPWVLVVLAIGISAYVPLGVRRGGMQGTCSFLRLGSNFLTEASTRLIIAVVLVMMGYGVMGATGAVSASIIAAYFLPRMPAEFRATPQTALQPASFMEGMQASVFFVGQVIINNIDILLVKHFFSPEQAGVYAAVSLIGRVLYVAGWSSVSAMFPVSAASKPQDSGSHVIVIPLLFVIGLSLVFILASYFFPVLILGTIFGRGFAYAGSLLTLYAAATGIYSLSVVLMAFEMSRRIANTGWLQLIFSGIVVLAIAAFHQTLEQVIIVRIVLMALMLVLVSFPFVRRYRQVLAPQQETI